MKGFASWPPQLDLEITICIEIFSDWDVKHVKDRASVFLREFKKNDRHSLRLTGGVPSGGGNSITLKKVSASVFILSVLFFWPWWISLGRQVSQLPHAGRLSQTCSSRRLLAVLFLLSDPVQCDSAWDAHCTVRFSKKKKRKSAVDNSQGHSGLCCMCESSEKVFFPQSPPEKAFLCHVCVVVAATRWHVSGLILCFHCQPLLVVILTAWVELCNNRVCVWLISKAKLHVLQCSIW